MGQKIEVHTRGEGYDEAAHIVDDPVTEPGDGEIRVRNHFAGVNGLFDTMVMRGKVGYINIKAPFDLGVESVGVVEAVGSNVSLNVGDAVASTGLGSAYRHRHIISADKAYKIPAPDPKYLAIVPTGISALVSLEQIAELKPGETVAITAAAGGLGHIWVQLAVNMGCRVVGIAGSDAKCEFVKSLGAEHCINYKSDSIADVLSRDYKDSLDVAVDTVGGDIHDALLQNIAPHGRLLISGNASEIVSGPQIDMRPRIHDAIYWKNASVRGFMNALLPEYHRDAAMRLFKMMEDGKLNIAIDPTHFVGLEAVPAASAHMMSGSNIGKTVLDLR